MAESFLQPKADLAKQTIAQLNYVRSRLPSLNDACPENRAFDGPESETLEAYATAMSISIHFG